MKKLVSIYGRTKPIPRAEAWVAADISLSTYGSLTIWSDDAAGLRALARALMAAAEALDPTPVIAETREAA